MLFAKCTDSDLTPEETLKNENQALKGRCDMLKKRCDMLEKTVQDLQSRCDMHQNVLDTWREDIIELKKHTGIFNVEYGGVQF